MTANAETSRRLCRMFTLPLWTRPEMKRGLSEGVYSIGAASGNGIEIGFASLRLRRRAGRDRLGMFGMRTTDLCGCTDLCG